jgi:hypothetical protein
MFDEYAEHLNPFYKDDCPPPLCSDFDTSKDIVCLRKVAHDFSSQPSVITLPCFSFQGVVGKYRFRVEFPPGQTLDFKGWLGNTISSQFFNLLLMICQSPTNFLSILPLEHENALGNQFTCPLSCFAEPSMFHDPFLDRIECFSQRWTWQDFCYPRYLGITRRSCLEAHMVLDMEYREQELPEHGPGGPFFSFSARFVLPAVPASITTGLGLYQRRLLLHEVIGPRYHGMCHI